MRRSLGLLCAALSVLVCVVGVAASPAAAAARAKPKVHHLHVTAHGSGAVTLTWTNPKSTSFRSTVVRYARGTKAPKTAHSGRAAGHPGRHTHTLHIKHLAAGQRYTFALFPVLSHHRHGARASIVALAAPAAVTNARTFAESGGTRLTWTNPRTKSVHRVVVRYALGSAAPASPTSGHAAAVHGARPTSALLTHLRANHHYAVSVFALDSRHGYSTPAIARFTTAAPGDDDGTYAGRVTDQAHHPLSGVELSGYGNTGKFAAVAASTGTDGRFTVPLPSGEYLLSFDGQRIRGGSSDATGYVGDTRDVVVRAGRTTRAGDIVLRPGAALTGTITDAAGTPLRGVAPVLSGTSPYVAATDSDDVGFVSYTAGLAVDTSVVTGTDGKFLLKGVPTDSALRLCADTSGAVTGGGSDTAGYDGRCEPTTVVAAPGTSKPVPTLKLAAATTAAAGTVRGRVTAKGVAIPGASVALVSKDDGGGDIDDGFYFGQTDGAGRYEIADVPAGSYAICTSSDYVSAKLPTGLIGSCADKPVTVTGGATGTRDVTLTLGGAVTGTLDGPGGHRLPGATVYVTDGDGDGDGGVGTDSHGQYTLLGLPAGTYDVCFVPSSRPTSGPASGAAPGCHHGAVAVTAGRDRSGIDATLGRGAALSGRVTDAAGHGVAGITVDAASDDDDDDGDGVGDSTATTDASGRYTLAGLTPGSYDVCFFAVTAGGQDTTVCASRSTAVFAGSITRNVNAALPADSGIRVVVTDKTGAPVAGVDAAALSACSNGCGTQPVFNTTQHVAVDASFTTDAHGVALLDGISPGDYAVCLFAYDATTASGGALTGYADGCSGTGFTVHVTRGAITAAPLTLADGGAVSGTVTAAGNHPVYNARAVVSGSAAADFSDSDPDDEDDFGDATDDTATDPSSPLSGGVTFSDGTYTVLGVRPGHQTVCVDASGATGASAPGYVDQCPDGTGGTPVTVTADQVSGGTDVVLAPASGVRGTVHVSGSVHPKAVLVEVFAGRNVHEQVGFAQTDPTGGTYEIDRLAPGQYTVCVMAYGVGGQCWKNVAWPAGSDAPPLDRATLITTTAGAVTKGVDATITG